MGGVVSAGVLPDEVTTGDGFTPLPDDFCGDARLSILEAFRRSAGPPLGFAARCAKMEELTAVDRGEIGSLVGSGDLGRWMGPDESEAGAELVLGEGRCPENAAGEEGRGGSAFDTFFPGGFSAFFGSSFTLGITLQGFSFAGAAAGGIVTGIELTGAGSAGKAFAGRGAGNGPTRFGSAGKELSWEAGASEVVGRSEDVPSGPESGTPVGLGGSTCTWEFGSGNTEATAGLGDNGGLVVTRGSSAEFATGGTPTSSEGGACIGDCTELALSSTGDAAVGAEDTSCSGIHEERARPANYLFRVVVNQLCFRSNGEAQDCLMQSNI